MIEGSSGTYEVSMYHFHALGFISSHIVSPNLFNTKPRREEKYIFALYREYIYELRKQQKVVDCYPQFLPKSERVGFVQRIRTLFSKYRNREENSISGIFRNVMWI